MSKIHLLTGSNIGNSLEHLKQAFTYIENRIGHIAKSSSVYKTEPWGNKNQQDFLNQVLEVQTEMDAEDVLTTILQIEHEMGRNRNQKWEARIIDIDILFYSNQIIQTENLKIPHPLLHERMFTLLPLNEIAPAFIHPVLHQSVSNLLSKCSDNSVVNLYS